MRKSFRSLYIALILIFLYAPIITLIVLSFNKSKTRSKWGGFTLQWYAELFKNEAIMSALVNTLIIALLSALIATIIGLIACITMQRVGKRTRSVITGITNIPMLNAEIVTGISMMLLFISANLFLNKFGMNVKFGFWTVLISHITFNIPYVMLSILPRMKQLNPSVYEAAMDLGASPLKAFFKVVLPDIMPGILSGFLMALTMSLDDFIITHFTKGPGFDTISTKVYTEVRKGIKPEMYALSTIIFVSVFVLLLLVNKTPKESKKKKETTSLFTSLKNVKRKKLYGGILIATILIFVFVFASPKDTENTNGKVVVYNWGEYIDPDVLEQFEEETGITVVYDEFETNESMYAKVATGAVHYDLICPSDYMIKKMIDEDLLQTININNLENYDQIGSQYLEQARQFDPTNAYTIPYCWGTVGILYNKTMVEEPIDEWADLWNEKYADNILMQDSVRDAFLVSLKMLGYSANETDEAKLKEACEKLIEQKPIVQAYVVDQVRDKMISGEAAIGVIYSGEAIFTQRENADLEYTIPKEGSNVWIDGWVMPKDAENVENAEKFLSFLLRPDIALKNFEYITYSTPNEGARALIEDEDIKNSSIAFPDLSQYELEVYQYLGPEIEKIYNDLWKKVGSANQ